MDINKHKSTIKEILIKQGALDEIPRILNNVAQGAKTAVFCDDNTYRAAGRKVEELLSGNINLQTCSTGLSPKPDEKAIGSLLLDLEQGTECLIAVGSGTINDLTRFIAYRLNIPFISVATAPSMDGYASSVSPILINGFKTTVPAKLPSAFIADVDVLINAPDGMKAAGFGDLAGKVIARVDWHVGNVVNDEEIDEYSLSMISEVLDHCLKLLDSRKLYGPEMLTSLTEGLVVSGLAIARAGTTRPVSGSEHAISHYLGLRSLAGEAPSYLHGEKVALGTFLMAQIYHRMFSYSFSEFKGLLKKAFQAESREQRSSRLSRVYGSMAEPALKRWADRMPDEARLADIIKRMSGAWERLQTLVTEIIPDPDDMALILEKSKVPFKPGLMGFSSTEIEDTLICAKEINDKYTLLNLLDEIGLLEYFAKEISGSK